jgi:hypothetical protein
MAASDQPARGAGRAVLLTLLAMVFLAVIGASVGYIAAVRTNATAATGNGNRNGHTGNRNNRNPTPTRNVPGPPPEAQCPGATVQAAKDHGSPGGLIPMIWVETDKSEAWICRDSAGRLWYQGHSKSAAEQKGASREPFVEGKNSLFLTDVQTDGEGYVATNNTDQGTTTFHVSRNVLLIVHSDGKKENQSVNGAYLRPK